MENQYYFANTNTFQVGVTTEPIEKSNHLITANNKYDLWRNLNDYIHGARVSILEMIKQAKTMDDVNYIMEHHDLTVAKLDEMLIEINELEPTSDPEPEMIM